MGGKNPAIVAASADLEGAAEGVARSAFGLSGQKCSACSRAIVLDEVHDEFVELIAEFSSSLKLGDPADRDAFLGPVINEVSRRASRRPSAMRAATARWRPAAAGPRARGTSSSRPS